MKGHACYRLLRQKNSVQLLQSHLDDQNSRSKKKIVKYSQDIRTPLECEGQKHERVVDRTCERLWTWITLEQLEQLEIRISSIFSYESARSHGSFQICISTQTNLLSFLFLFFSLSSAILKLTIAFHGLEAYLWFWSSFVTSTTTFPCPKWISSSI